MGVPPRLELSDTILEFEDRAGELVEGVPVGHQTMFASHVLDVTIWAAARWPAVAQAWMTVP